MPKNLSEKEITYFFISGLFTSSLDNVKNGKKANFDK